MDADAELDAALVAGDLRVDQLAAQRLEPTKRFFLVGPDQPRVAGDIGDQDRRQPAFDPLSPGIHGPDAIAIFLFTIARAQEAGCLALAPAETREFAAADGSKFGEPGFEDLPDDLALARVFVGKDIPHSEDLPPRNMRVTRFQIVI